MKHEIVSYGTDAALPERGEALGDAAPAHPELRNAPRFTFVLRTAKLLVDGREYLCVLRDISATGVKIKLFHPLPHFAKLALELDGGQQHAVHVAWVVDDHAGLRFVEAIDVAASLDAPRDDRPRRQPRITVDHAATIYAHGQEVPARLRNLSQQGACIETDDYLCLRERLRIASDLVPEMTATVCWRSQPRYGMVFETSFKLDALARLVERMQDPAQRG